MLLALGVMAALLAALAAAMQATFVSFEENRDVAAVSQSARWALNRIMGDIRTADGLSTTSTQVTIVPPDTGSGLTQVRYAYENDVLNCYRTVNGNTTSSVMLGDGEIDLTTFVVSREWGTDAYGDSCIVRATIRLEFSVEGKTLAMTASAAPRRNQTW